VGGEVQVIVRKELGEGAETCGKQTGPGGGGRGKCDEVSKNGREKRKHEPVLGG